MGFSEGGVSVGVRSAGGDVSVGTPFRFVGEGQEGKVGVGRNKYKNR